MVKINVRVWWNEQIFSIKKMVGVNWLNQNSISIMPFDSYIWNTINNYDMGML